MENEKKCVIGGEILRQSDGIDTVVGSVCNECQAVFVQAELDYCLAGEPGDVRSYIAARLSGAAFVSDMCMRHVSSGDAVRLKAMLLRGVSVPDYDSQLFQNVEGLTLESALACIDEGKRTFAYIRAIFSHLDQLAEVNDKIEVLDAGCGPVPVFGIMAALKSDKARVVCLEINPVSYEMAKEVVEKLGLEGRVRIVCVDARLYKHDVPVDLLVSETMYAGLTDEPMVQILDNLSGQMSGLGRVVPSRIDVHAKLVWPEYCDREGGDNVVFHEIAALDNVASYIPGKNKLQLIKFVFPLVDDRGVGGPYGVMVSSTVDLGVGIVLSGIDSTITKPALLGKYVLPKEGDKFFKVSYVPGMRRFNMGWWRCEGKILLCKVSRR